MVARPHCPWKRSGIERTGHTFYRRVQDAAARIGDGASGSIKAMVTIKHNAPGPSGHGGMLSLRAYCGMRSVFWLKVMRLPVAAACAMAGRLVLVSVLPAARGVVRITWLSGSGFWLRKWAYMASIAWLK